MADAVADAVAASLSSLSSAGVALAYKGISTEIATLSPMAGGYAKLAIASLKSYGIDVEKLATDAIAGVVTEIASLLPADLAKSITTAIGDVASAIPAMGAFVQVATFAIDAITDYISWVNQTKVSACKNIFQKKPYSADASREISPWDVLNDSWLGSTIRLAVCKYTPGHYLNLNPAWEKNTYEWTCSREYSEFLGEFGYPTHKTLTKEMSETRANVMYAGLVANWRAEALLRGSSETKAQAASGKVGLSLERRLAYRRIIEGILMQPPTQAKPGSETEKTAPIGDQGASLWPVLVDMLWKDFKNGRLCWSFVNYCVTRSVGNDGSGPYMSRYTTGRVAMCHEAKFDGRTFDDLKVAALDQLHELIDYWYATAIEPGYQSVEEARAEALRSLGSALALLDGGVLWTPGVKLELAGPGDPVVAHVGGLVIAPKSTKTQSSAIVPLALGAAAALYFWR